MRRTHYTTAIRVLLCEACGAPIETTPAGGHVPCSFCRAQNVVSLRPKASAQVPPPSMPIDENERLRRLRMQDGRPLVPPQSLAYLLQGGTFAPEKVQEAFHVYQATRKEVTATHSPEAAERLYFLTLMMNTHLGLSNDDSRRRALLETSLETLSLPRHVQVLRCLLASASAKENDVASAEQWIAPCNPRSDDLQADSGWRCARAFIDTVKGDFHSVINTLGHLDDQVPVDDAWDPTAAVLRANALEKLGDMNAAVTALRARMGKESHDGRAMMEKVIGAHPQLALCAHSFPHATRGHSQEAAQKVARGADGGIGSIFFYVGLFILAIGLVIALGIIFVAIIGDIATGASLQTIIGTGIGALFGAFMAFITTVPLGAIFAGVGYFLRKQAQQAAWLRINGIPAKGTIRGYQPTGTRINGVPVVRVEVHVQHPNLAPYVASFKQLLSGSLASQLQAGKVVPLRVHPQKPTEIILESA